MPFADRRSDGVLVSVLASLALLGGCAARPEGAPAVADGRYDSRFPQEDVAPLLERISRSVHMVTAIAYYKVHTVPLSDSIESSNLPPELLDRYAQGARYINSVNVGASTIVGLGTRQTLVLTCAHVVNYPDTIFTYHLTAGGVPSRFLSSIGLRARVSVSVGIFPQGGELELVALDSGEDLALLGAQQDVGKNRQRGAGADDILHGLQPGNDLFFGDGEVHARLICILLLKNSILIKGCEQAKQLSKPSPCGANLNRTPVTSSSYTRQ